MRRSTLGRGLDSLIHVVEEPQNKELLESLDRLQETAEKAVIRHIGGLHALTPTPLRLDVRSRLDRLSTRPRHGLKAAQAYLDKLRQADGRTHVETSLPPGVDLTSCTMVQLQKGRVVDSIRHSFFGLVSIWK